MHIEFFLACWLRGRHQVRGPACARAAELSHCRVEHWIGCWWTLPDVISSLHDTRTFGASVFQPHESKYAIERYGNRSAHE
jgi:hypothetical protein